MLGTRYTNIQVLSVLHIIQEVTTMELFIFAGLLLVWMIAKLAIKPLWTQYKCTRCGRIFDSEDAANAHSAGHAHKIVPME